MLLPQTTLARLKTQHEVIEFLISGLSEDELRFRPIPDKWSVQENIAHLACYQQRVISRTERILDEENPTFESYVPEEDPQFPIYLSKPKNELLSNLISNRIELVHLISNLTDEQLMRNGTHAKFGKMNLIGWTEFFLLHEAHHLYTIFKLIRSIKKSL